MTEEQEATIARAHRTVDRPSVRIALLIQDHCLAWLAVGPGQIGGDELAGIARAARIADGIIERRVGPAR